MLEVDTSDGGDLSQIRFNIHFRGLYPHDHSG